MARPGFPVPEDKFENGCGIRGWVNCTLYGDTIKEVVKKKADYFAQYDPRGYDTHTVGNIYRHPEGYYSIHIKRWSTCS